jgi:hypothetical protein
MRICFSPHADTFFPPHAPTAAEEQEEQQAALDYLTPVYPVAGVAFPFVSVQ